MRNIYEFVDREIELDQFRDCYKVETADLTVTFWALLVPSRQAPCSRDEIADIVEAW